jgi:hypothetical protein
MIVPRAEEIVVVPPPPILNDSPTGLWSWMSNCVLDNGVRILSRSRGQKIRGLKHRQHRPKLVVADDVEDLKWVRTQENRDKSDRWMRGNVLPSSDEHAAAWSSGGEPSLNVTATNV